jgi:ATP-dependent helicase/nuclease subunit B
MDVRISHLERRWVYTHRHYEAHRTNWQAMLDNLFQQTSAQTTILTPNKRLALWIADQFNQRQTQTWARLDVLPFQHWLERCFHEALSSGLLPPKRLLSTTQTSYLWQQIVKKQLDLPLLPPQSTAQTASSAWKTLNRWCLDFQDPRIAQTPDGLCFQTWAALFQNTCDDKKYIDSSRLLAALLPLFAARAFKKTPTIIFAGFLDLTPEQQQLIETLTAAGYTVSQWNAKQITPAQEKRYRFHTTADELKAMALFAKQTASAHPNAQIACIVPDITQQYDKLNTTFRAVFNLPTTDAYHLPFSISFGQALTKTPIISIAFLLLFLKKENSHTTLTHLLLTPFIAGAETEQHPRALLDVRIKDFGSQTLSLNTLFYLAKDSAPIFVDRLEKIITQPAPKKQTLEQWADYFLEKLFAFGWPGERPLNSNEYQAVERFKQLLNELIQMHPLVGPCSHHNALQLLQQLATQTLFQPKSNPNAKIQVLGILEATGIAFDHVWMMGMDDRQWPPSPRTNPFIPAYLQRELNMPHATPSRELLFCQQVLQQLKNTRQQLIFSHAEQSESIPLQPSALISAVALEDQPKQPEKKERPCLETLIDEQAPPVGQNDAIRGGSSILQRQAACPFQAFALSRLHAYPLEEPAAGLNARERGTLLHASLENIWQGLKTQAALQSLTEQTLKDKIALSVDHALKKIQHKSLSETYLLLEKERLIALITTWLTLEKTRADFTVVACEQQISLCIEQLNLTLRIDRIDQLHTGESVLIDYKTGSASPQSWLGDRPDQPQLPLYTLAFQKEISAISFAKLSQEHCKFIGISTQENILPNVKPQKDTDFAQLQTQWRAALKTLAKEFMQGVSSVNPKNREATCRFCKLAGLCRITKE